MLEYLNTIVEHPEIGLGVQLFSHFVGYFSNKNAAIVRKNEHIPHFECGMLDWHYPIWVVFLKSQESFFTVIITK